MHLHLLSSEIIFTRHSKTCNKLIHHNEFPYLSERWFSLDILECVNVLCVHLTQCVFITIQWDDFRHTFYFFWWTSVSHSFTRICLYYLSSEMIFARHPRTCYTLNHLDAFPSPSNGMIFFRYSRLCCTFFHPNTYRDYSPEKLFSSSISKYIAHPFTPMHFYFSQVK